MRPETATSITDDRQTPNRKTASRSVFSSNNSTTSDNEYSVIGADCTIPELGFQGGYIALVRRYFNSLVRRAPGIQLPIAIYIIGQTESAARRPEYAKIPIKDLMMLTGAKERMNWEALAKLECSGLLKRDGQGGYKMCLEAIDDVPLPTARTCKRRAKNAANHAPSSIAALHLNAVGNGTINENQITEPSPEVHRGACTSSDTGESSTYGYRAACSGPGSPTDARADKTVGLSDSDGGVECAAEFRDDGTPIGDGSERRQADDRNREEMVYGIPDVVGRLQLSAVNDATNFQKPATYCPWNWVCPHLSTASPLVSIETKKHIEPTTTGAIAPSETQERARCLTPSPDEIPYLARFSQPASRIGEALQIDDDAAGRMWAECVARNARLTPREFVAIARMKMREWARVDDASPGMRVRNVTGLLIGSMPSAVVGALYLAAHEQAPAELARDVREARDVLADDAAAPRDRAWARAILAEAERGT